MAEAKRVFGSPRGDVFFPQPAPDLGEPAAPTRPIQQLCSSGRIVCSPGFSGLGSLGGAVRDPAVGSPSLQRGRQAVRGCLHLLARRRLASSLIPRGLPRLTHSQWSGS